MKRIGKGDFYAIIECACFAIGALLLALVIFVINAPEWLLWLGFGLAIVGVVLWLRPLFEKLLFPNRQKLRQVSINDEVDDIDHYELHRPQSYTDPDHPDLDF